MTTAMCVIGWAAFGLVGYVYASNYLWERFGDVLGFTRSDRGICLAMAAMGPFGVYIVLTTACMNGRLELLWSPREPRDSRFLRYWSPDE